MKNLLFISAFTLLSTSFLFSQGRLGFTNDINGGIFQVVYKRLDQDMTSKVVDTNAHIKFYNGNFRFGGSVIGTKIFEDSDSPFFVGEYIQFGLGFGIGTKYGNSTYSGTTFNLLVGMNVGAVASYSLSDELTVGLKWIALGGDIYFDFDENAVYRNGMTFHPTAQYKNYWASVGFGGKKTKEGDLYKTLDIEARYNFSEDQEESKYVGLRFQSNGYNTVRANSDGSNSFKYSQSIVSMGIILGFYF